MLWLSKEVSCEWQASFPLLPYIHRKWSYSLNLIIHSSGKYWNLDFWEHHFRGHKHSISVVEYCRNINHMKNHAHWINCTLDGLDWVILCWSYHYRDGHWRALHTRAERSPKNGAWVSTISDSRVPVDSRVLDQEKELWCGLLPAILTQTRGYPGTR